MIWLIRLISLKLVISVKASETTLLPMLEQTRQYVVPLFQRTYSWQRKQWKTLWDDLVDLCDKDDNKTHFMGSVVYMQTVSVPEGVPKYLLIDGQQRLTTLFLLLILLRDKADQPELAEEISERVLINKFKRNYDKYKLLPTQSDRDAYFSLLEGRSTTKDHLIIQAYKFFEREVTKSKIPPNALFKIITERLYLVNITLQHDDNPYVVFESLNATGLPLTQADLIRNFFFMRVVPDHQQDIHVRYWLPMQNRLGEAKLTTFIRHYLMSAGRIVNERDVYFTLKSTVQDGDAITELERISLQSEYYYSMINPHDEANPQLRKAFSRLELLGTTTYLPLTLRCYDDYKQRRLSLDDFIESLHALENFLLRRLVCRSDITGFNKVAPFLYNRVQQIVIENISFPNALKQVLNREKMPLDREFVDHLTNDSLYGQGDLNTRTRLILQSLEESYGHKEPVNTEQLTIEHDATNAFNRVGVCTWH